MKRLLLILMILSLVAACGPVVKYPTAVVNSPEIATARYPTVEYRIQPGDTLEVRFYNNPELNETVTVRPDGKISLQLAPEARAAGLTPEELSRQLTGQYSQELRNPKIAVLVRTPASNRVYVGGEVFKPGVVSLLAPLTVFQSITEAGGLTNEARTKEIVIIRKGEKKPIIFTVNLANVIDGSNLSEDVTLMPFDIVFVPKSPIANVDLWVDQYLRRLIPIPFGFGYTF